jgi:hypothetical protein
MKPYTFQNSFIRTPQITFDIEITYNAEGETFMEKFYSLTQDELTALNSIVTQLRINQNEEIRVRVTQTIQ